MYIHNFRIVRQSFGDISQTNIRIERGETRNISFLVSFLQQTSMKKLILYFEKSLFHVCSIIAGK